MSQPAAAPLRGAAFKRGSRGGRGRGGRGGSEAPAKKGPPPARHIPWPEIFKHHISLVEGHLKMIDMVRKHTIEGTGNHKTICSLIDRARAMLKDAKTTEREFVPPKEAWRNIPIGSASDTMYPGYSPKDHQYGKAAEEFGREWSEARKKGIEFNAKPDGPQYEFGQSKGAKRIRLTEENVETAQVSSDQVSGSEAAKSDAPAESTGNDPLFFFDSKPTPVNGTGGSNAAARSLVAETPAKNSKNSNENETSAQDEATSRPEPVIEYDNIDREVDAQHRLKEEAKKNKKNNKRKRDSATSDGAVENNEPAQKPVSKKNKSKKEKNSEKKASKANASAEFEDIEMPDADQDDAAVSGKKKKSKRFRKQKNTE